MKTLEQYAKEFEGKDCKWCMRDRNRTVPLDNLKVEHYNHDGGWDVEGYSNKQWLYVSCPNCRYQWSFAKLHLCTLPVEVLS